MAQTGTVSDAWEHADRHALHCRSSHCPRLGRWQVRFRQSRGRIQPHYWCSEHLPQKYRLSLVFRQAQKEDA